MELENLVSQEQIVVGNVSSYKPERVRYALFSEQYLERPVISGDYKMAITPSACTIKGIPVIDDW